MPPLWTPSPERIARARLTMFSRHIASRWNVATATYADLHRFSLDRPGDFWRSVWDFCGVAGDPGARAVVDLDRMPGARFFPDARLNFAENLLRARDGRPALVFQGKGRRREP
jgi:acetoacetyl-CoA synthetase